MSEETAYRMGKNFPNYSSNGRLVTRIYKELKEKNKHILEVKSKTINKWANESEPASLKRQSTNVTHKHQPNFQYSLPPGKCK